MNNDSIKIKEKDWRSFRTKLKIMTFLAIIFFILSVTIFIEGYSLEKVLQGKSTIIGEGINQNNETITNNEMSEESIANYITSIFNVFVNWKSGFFIKFLVFLGIIYLLQIMFTLAFDILELLLLFGVLVIKIFKLITYPIKYFIRKNEKTNK